MRRYLLHAWPLRLAFTVPGLLLVWRGLIIRGALSDFVERAAALAATHVPSDPSKLGFLSWLMNATAHLLGDFVLVAGALLVILALLPWGALSPREQRGGTSPHRQGHGD